MCVSVFMDEVFVCTPRISVFDCERICVVVYVTCLCVSATFTYVFISLVTLHFRLTRARPVRERSKQKGHCHRHIFTIIGYEIQSDIDLVLLNKTRLCICKTKLYLLLYGKLNLYLFCTVQVIVFIDKSLSEDKIVRGRKRCYHLKRDVSGCN